MHKTKREKKDTKTLNLKLNEIEFFYSIFTSYVNLFL